MVLVNKARKYLLFAAMHLQLTVALLLSTNISPTLAMISHDLITSSLEGRQQVSLYKSIPENEYLADSPLTVLAITTKELRDEAKAPKNAEKRGNLFGAISMVTNKWTVYYTKHVPQRHFTSQAG